MANEKTTEEAAVPAVQATKKKAGKGMTIVVLIFVLALAGSGTWYLRHGKARASESPKRTDTLPVNIIHLESFIVNLADTDQVTYLRVSIEVGTGKAPSKKESETLPTAPIRDAILGVLATRKSQDLLTPEGKLRLKQDLLAALNEKVPGLDAREIYFTDFLVQR